MAPLGFSTGAIARGDFRSALRVLLQVEAKAVELSALRLSELPDLVNAFADLDLDHFDYVSVHAPSGFSSLEEQQVIELLRCLPGAVPVVLHPDAISDASAWRLLGKRLLLENMDQRKSTGRNLKELEPWLEVLPDAGICLDLGHAKQIDSTMSVATMILLRYADRIRQLHVSEVTPAGKHVPMSYAARSSFSRLASLIPSGLPVIIESVVGASQVARELELTSCVLRGEVEAPFPLRERPRVA